MDSERTFKELWRFSISRQKWFKMKISGAVTPNVASMAAVVVDDNATATAKVLACSCAKTKTKTKSKAWFVLEIMCDV